MKTGYIHVTRCACVRIVDRHCNGYFPYLSDLSEKKATSQQRGRDAVETTTTITWYKGAGAVAKLKNKFPKHKA